MSSTASDRHHNTSASRRDAAASPLPARAHPLPPSTLAAKHESGHLRLPPQRLRRPPSHHRPEEHRRFTATRPATSVAAANPRGQARVWPSDRHRNFSAVCLPAAAILSAA
ncbi:Os12g0203166 [Oryza sativa Japonica Group]|uniref:Os12g0203166 protein n=1 Tax=Oryza sativa subsp. japonica TaxID=39947 RepID=A0A0P0Y7Z8_ORYSJ|nr:Os12g0203166 [Oryza sativa Japonica Group]